MAKKIERLTSEQRALIPVYQEKWRKIAFSTEAINKQQATQAVKEIYQVIGKKTPAVRFFSSPEILKQEIFSQPPEQLAQELGAPILTIPSTFELFLGELNEQIETQLWQELTERLAFQERLGAMMQVTGIIWTQIAENSEQIAQLQEYLFWEQQQQFIRDQLRKLPGGDLLIQLGDWQWEMLGKPLWEGVGEPLLNKFMSQPEIREWEQTYIQPILGISSSLGLTLNLFRSNFDVFLASVVDYCISVLECEVDARKWLRLKSLIIECGWFLPFERTCWVLERPNQLSFDSENRLHAEGKAAIKYTDGYSIYLYRGVVLPEKYGEVHPNLWQSEWLLSEQNAELRRVLIQGIGYDRLCQELAAKEIDSWREYTLLEIENEVDIEPIHLLKMTCPSTGYIHATRVPPDILSAREAIRWTNQGIDPEEFSIET
ncbi:MAG: hypothetical protein SAL07_00520 [Oscillatoria sp. PMC 1051.18]|nr:hypothetical protein [Oscillatoria sp. PMC 1050.18]MEC5028370.1 hypothetical protein [Oscillatoria sp. PMC 1051.18]